MLSNLSKYRIKGMIEQMEQRPRIITVTLNPETGEGLVKFAGSPSVRTLLEVGRIVGKLASKWGYKGYWICHKEKSLSLEWTRDEISQTAYHAKHEGGKYRFKISPKE